VRIQFERLESPFDQGPYVLRLVVQRSDDR